MLDSNEFFSEEIKSAVERYEKLLQSKEPMFFDDETFENIIDFYISKNKASKAYHAANMALQLNSYNVGFKTRKAQALILLNDLEKALNILMEAELLEP